MQGLSIGKLASEARMSADTIRFYERRGLLSPAERGKSGYRRYSERQLHQLLVIRGARQIGFTLEQIAELFALRPGEDLAHLKTVIQDKLESVGRKIAALQRWNDALAHLIEAPLAPSPSGCPEISEYLMRTTVGSTRADESDSVRKSHATK
jgi:DNA-binding transcriptional MerR regulator